MTAQTFASVWDAIEDTPAEAENMKMRSALMMQIKERITAQKLSQTEAARLLGITQPVSPTSCAAASACSASTRWSTWRRGWDCGWREKSYLAKS